MITFETQPNPEQFSYNLLLGEAVDPVQVRITGYALEAVETVRKTYDINVQVFTELSKLERNIRESQALLKTPYVLFAGINIGDQSVLAKTKLNISSLKSIDRTSRINIASWFNLKTEQIARNIPNFDHENGINTIFADEIFGSSKLISLQDIIDNIVCETIRAKVRMHRDSALDTELVVSEEHFSYDIEKLRMLFTKYKLYHRGPTDGAVAFTLPDSSYIFGTSTKTNKTHMTQDDYSIYGSNDGQSLQFSGKKIPSSDSPELLSLASKFKYSKQTLPSLFIHFHHPVATRSQQLALMQTNQEIEYGRFESGDKIYHELKRLNSNWLILRNHGFLWTGSSIIEFEQWIKSTLNHFSTGKPIPIQSIKPPL